MDKFEFNLQCKLARVIPLKNKIICALNGCDCNYIVETSKMFGDFTELIISTQTENCYNCDQFEPRGE